MHLLKHRGIKKSDLTKLLGISSRTIAKISNGDKIANSVITKLCDFLNCTEKDIVLNISDNPILQRLREEKQCRMPGGIYHEIQIRMTYNSNHIEGSTLTEEQTRQIFETSSVGFYETVNVDDIVETVNHFRAIDYCIDIAEENLSEEIIKHFHYLLKRSTSDEMRAWFNVGEYKALDNAIGAGANIINTSSAKNVASDMSKLIKSYLSIENSSLEDIIKFHYEFEKIHPFQDGNGRVGRLIAFKECLKHNVIPFIIEDSKKRFYYRGLQEYLREPGYLIDTCYDGQDTMKKILDLFGIPYPTEKV